MVSRRHDDTAAKFPGSLDRVEELTEERRCDALRALTHQHNQVKPIEPHPGGKPYSGVREVMVMLGLLEVEERTEESGPVDRAVLLAAVDYPERVVACPDCLAPPGAPCRTLTAGRNQAYHRGHVARHRRVEERP